MKQMKNTPSDTTTTAQRSDDDNATQSNEFFDICVGSFSMLSSVVVVVCIHLTLFAQNILLHQSAGFALLRVHRRQIAAVAAPPPRICGFHIIIPIFTRALCAINRSDRDQTSHHHHRTYRSSVIILYQLLCCSRAHHQAAEASSFRVVVCAVAVPVPVRI